MITINDIKLINGKRVSQQEETGTQIEDLRELANRAQQYASDLEMYKRNMIDNNEIVERLEKSRSRFLAAVSFAMVYENESNGGSEV
ncbi:MAG: hypothetical protein PHV07_04225 [Oscillospiraceae bacterium]|nr:hypothetical protein [Oscillospiraceae bacterium]